jgi:hypothetical protein
MFTALPPGGVGVGNMGPLANAFTDARATTANTTTKRDFDTIEIIEKKLLPVWNLYPKGTSGRDSISLQK